MRIRRRASLFTVPALFVSAIAFAQPVPAPAPAAAKPPAPAAAKPPAPAAPAAAKPPEPAAPAAAKPPEPAAPAAAKPPEPAAATVPPAPEPPALHGAIGGGAFGGAATVPPAPVVTPAAISTAGSDVVTPVATPSAKAVDPTAEAPPTAQTPSTGDWTRYIELKGFLQPQLIFQVFNAAASPNANAEGTLPFGINPNDVIATSSGDSTNRSFFRLRRARLTVVVTPNAASRFTIELEPLARGGSVPGSGTIARTLEAVAIARLSDDVRLEVGAGQFKVPFGFELKQSDVDRPFIERSWSASNLFPGEFDIGARARFFARKDKLQIQTAVLNGVTLGERNEAVLPDLNRAKDYALHANYNFGAADVGASGYFGFGQRVDAQKLRFKQFQRWAVNAELALHHTFAKSLGETRAYAEATYGTNMDRGVNYAFALPDIPSDIFADVVDKNQLGTFVRAEQDITKWATAGLRYDFYTPDLAVSDSARHTISAVAVGHFNKNLKIMLEYTSASDRVHASSATAQTRTVDALSTTLQGRF